MALALLLSAAAVLIGAGTANAGSYQYWGYYSWSNGKWAFATKGPAQTTPADGSVEGWRFAITGAKPRPPRADGDFAAICRHTKAKPGKKRVAVVIDPGLPSEAPTGDTAGKPHGACALVATSASGAVVLNAVAHTRISKGLVCGIDGYPSTGCAQSVKASPPKTADAPVKLALPKAPHRAVAASSDSGTPWTGIVIVVLILAALGGGGLWMARSRARS
jgi:hypothetical protein